jgi:hypothetical protein
LANLRVPRVSADAKQKIKRSQDRKSVKGKMMKNACAPRPAKVEQAVDFN